MLGVSWMMAMEQKKHIKLISNQAQSNITVDAVASLLKGAGIRFIFMGHDVWGNFTHSQVLYVVDGEGYIAKREKRHKDSSVRFVITRDGKKTVLGKHLTTYEKDVFKQLGLTTNNSIKSPLKSVAVTSKLRGD